MRCQPDKNANWVNLTDNDFETLLPLASKTTKAARRQCKERAIFKLFSLGVKTNRDDWVYDLTASTLGKLAYLIDVYKQKWKRCKDAVKAGGCLVARIKWTRERRSVAVAGGTP